MSNSESDGSESAGDAECKCNFCGKKFANINTLYKHSAVCRKRQGKELELTCKWCKLLFKNRGNLVTHAFHMHGDSSYKSAVTIKKVTKKHECTICDQTFMNSWQLKFHIRAMHFNLRGKIPYAEMKKVNQVWFEKVLNSKNIIEIRKTSPNTLVMRKLDENTSIQVNSDNGNIVDLSHMYPLNSKSFKIECKLCNEMYHKREMRKHINETHFKNVRHRCNNCTRTFTRIYSYIKHVCSKKPKIKGVLQGSTSMFISKVESLKCVSEPTSTS